MRGAQTYGHSGGPRTYALCTVRFFVVGNNEGAAERKFVAFYGFVQ